MLYGYAKPWKEALAIIIVVGFLGSMLMQHSGFFGFILIMIGIGLGGVYYFLNKKLTLGVVETCGILSVIEFSRSVTENQNIDEKEAKRVVMIVQALIDKR